MNARYWHNYRGSFKYSIINIPAFSLDKQNLACLTLEIDALFMLPCPSLQPTLVGPPSVLEGAARSLPSSPLPAGIPNPASCHRTSPCQKAGGSTACWWCTLLPKSSAVVNTVFFHSRETGNWMRRREIKQESGNVVVNLSIFDLPA